MRFLSSFSTLFTLALRRLWNHRLLMACLLAGLMVAVSLLSAIPLYTDAVQNRLLQGELTEAGTYRPPFAFLWRYIGAWHGEISWEAYQPINEYLTDQATAVLGMPIDEDGQIRHVSTAKLRLYPAGESSFAEGEPLLWSSVGFVSGLQAHIQLLEGTFPSADAGGLEILVSQATADGLGIQVGEAYTLFAPGDDGTRLPLRVVGVWQAIDLTEPFWFYQPDAFDDMLLTNEAAFEQFVVSGIEGAVETAVWYQIYDGGRIRPATVNRLLDNVAVVEARATALLNNVTLDASPVSALQSYGRSNSLLTFTLTVFSLPVLGLVLYFISLIASMVVGRRQSEIAILRSRGIPRGQILGEFLLEGLILGGIGMVGGLWLASGLAQLMGRTRTFLDPVMFGGGDIASLGIVLSPTAISYALFGVGLTLLAILIPAAATSRHTIVTLRWQQARALLAPLWQRYFLDVFLLIPPLYGYYLLTQQGTIGLLGGGNDPFANPLLFLVPILFCFSLGLFLIRFFPWLMRGLAWLADRLPGVTLLLMLRQLARSATQYLGPLLLLSLTVSLAAFTASMAVTLDDHLDDQVYYQVGTDLHLAELGQSNEEPSAGGSNQGAVDSNQSADDDDEPRWLFLPVTEHLTVPGVRAAARVGDYSATSNIGGRQRSGRILGVDRADFVQVAAFRPDFAWGESLGGLMNRLAVGRDHILVNDHFMAQNSLVVGDPLRLTIGAAGEFTDVEFTIVGTLALFPTQYPQDGPFFVANLDYVHEGFGEVYPYDVWLATDGETSPSNIISGVRELGITVVTDQDARQRILDEQTRPERQGLFGLLSVGFLAAAILTVLGFLVYAVVSFQRRFVELGVLRAVGLSIGQMAGYLIGELAILIMTGAGLGTVLGVWAADIFIPYFQVGNDKTALIPPFIVQVAWQQIGLIYVVFGIMFLVAVTVLLVLLVRMRVFEAVKLGEAM